MSMRTRFRPSIAGLGQGFRLLVVAFMLIAGIATLPGNATAKSSPLSGVFAQGATWEAHPQSQKNKSKDDDEDEDSGKSSKNSKNNKDDDEDEDSGKSSKNNKDDDEDEDSGKSSKNSKNDKDDDEDEDSSSGSKKTKLPRQWTRDGIVSETEYESPQYGYAVEWDDPWVIDEYYDNDESDTTATVISDEETGLDEFKIWSPDASGLLTIQFTPANGSDATDVMDYWESDEYYDGFTNGAEYLISDGDEDRAGVLFLIPGDNGDYIGYNEITMLDDGDTMLALYLRAPVDEFLDVYNDGNDSITVDDNEIFDILRSRDVRNAIRDL